MKLIVKALIFCLFPNLVSAQIDPTWGYIKGNQVDSVRNAFYRETNDTLKMLNSRLLGFYYQEVMPDSALYFHEQQLALAKKLNIKMWEADAYTQTAYALTQKNNIMQVYEYFNAAMELVKDPRYESSNWRPWTFSNAADFPSSRIAILAMNYQQMGNIWGALSNPEKQKEYYLEGVRLGQSINNGKILYYSYSSLGYLYTGDSAIFFIKKAEEANFNRSGFEFLNLSQAYYSKGMVDSSLYFANLAKQNSLDNNDFRALSNFYAGGSLLFSEMGERDSSMYYAKKALQLANSVNTPFEFLFSYQALASAYTLADKPDSAYKYATLSYQMNDSIKTAQIEGLKSFQVQSFNEQLRMRELEEEKTAYLSRLKMIGLFAVLMVILAIAIILYRSNLQKQKANATLESTLGNLKSTQSQLIQSEKMASLGELTAGIAHEIQNPLNFVNNFSEVNRELIAELKEEIEKGDLEEVKLIATDIEANEEKIHHHGKRADSIVKGMLEHSRANKGEKAPADLNALVDEFVRLSYHGLRAKDKSFNADFKLDLDPNLPKVNVVASDIGRVILNLVNNAFYAVNDKAKSEKTDSDYKPMVTVSSNYSPKAGGQEGFIQLSVQDNGSGIPDSIKEKIFQPFFTTKPTGSGTGLGLSLSYDIVKAHGGVLSVEDKSGEGTEFVIELPL